jgi:hypothetical protein
MGCGRHRRGLLLQGMEGTEYRCTTKRGGALSRNNSDPSSACGSWAIYATVPSLACGSGRPSAVVLEVVVIRQGRREAGQGPRKTSGCCTLLVVCNRRRTDHDYADNLGEIAGRQLAGV